MANNTMNDENKKKALDAAIAKLEKDFGKGAVMKLGDPAAQVHVETVPTGSLSLDLALGVGGVPKGRIIEIYGPESSGKKYRKEAALRDLSMQSMHWIRYMRRISV